MKTCALCPSPAELIITMKATAGMKARRQFTCIDHHDRVIVLLRRHGYKTFFTTDITEGDSGMMKLTDWRALAQLAEEIQKRGHPTLEQVDKMLGEIGKLPQEEKKVIEMLDQLLDYRLLLKGKEEEVT